MDTRTASPGDDYPRRDGKPGDSTAGPQGLPAAGDGRGLGLAPPEQALVAACLASPDDDAPRLAYAGWLDGRGRHEEADFLRIALGHFPALSATESRRGRAAAAAVEAWSRRLAPPVSRNARLTRIDVRLVADAKPGRPRLRGAEGLRREFVRGLPTRLVVGSDCLLDVCREGWIDSARVLLTEVWVPPPPPRRSPGWLGVWGECSAWGRRVGHARLLEVFGPDSPAAATGCVLHYLG